MGRHRIHPMLSILNSYSLLKELEEKGYVIIPNAVDGPCDNKVLKYQQWYASFKETGESIRRNNYVIDSYKISHSEPSWSIRASVRQLFGLVWGTDKLLTSVEGVVLYNPPEKGEGQFRTPEGSDLHLDQGVRRQGLHAYRGAVYLEESTEQDFCFQVLSKSHEYHSLFFREYPRAAARSKKNESIKLTEAERSCYSNKGCSLITVPVSKGAMLLWDSRMVYGFLPPVCGRPNIDRWTCISFVSMTPALWADENDLDIKKKAFKELLTTSHWSSQGQKIISEERPKKRNHNGQVVQENEAVTFIPATALWYPCQKLMGMMDYDFENEEPNGPFPPIWK